jgi:Rrf2 family transcriptional regulator, iron-sulfur cluster assembly transcription factor
MLYSRATAYAIKALVYMAAHPGHLTAAKIASATGMPPLYLASILRVLVSRGLLSSFRGASGGYELAVDPSGIRLIDVVETVDGEDWRSDCALGYPVCGEQKTCPLHERWRDLRTCIRQYLEGSNIRALMLGERHADALRRIE